MVLTKRPKKPSPHIQEKTPGPSNQMKRGGFPPGEKPFGMPPPIPKTELSAKSFFGLVAPASREAKKIPLFFRPPIFPPKKYLKPLN